MMRNILITLIIAVAASAAFLVLRPAPGAGICTSDEVLQAPSGHNLQLCDVLYEVQPSNESWAVIRVVDAALVGQATRADQGDHDWACETWGFAALEADPRPTRIIVQIMATAFERGEPSPGIIQSIEAYSESGGTCIWELF